jgi:hypothetical protein
MPQLKTATKKEEAFFFRFAFLCFPFGNRMKKRGENRGKWELESSITTEIYYTSPIRPYIRILLG